MLVDELPLERSHEPGVVRWLFDWAVYGLARFWAAWWWTLRVYVAARHGVPRSRLEDPPEAWLRVLQGPTDKDR